MNYEKIPHELRALNQWVVWKGEINEKGKMTKLPVNANTGANAMSNNPGTWSDFDTAVKAVAKYGAKGIGFMFYEGYFGIDLDDCTEELKQEFIKTLKSYTELSQSGKGIHIICRGKLPEGPRRKGNIEMYDTKRFFAMTGDSIGDYHDISDGTQAVQVLYRKYLSPTQSPVTFSASKTQNETLSDDDLIKKAISSRSGGLFSLLFAGQWEGAYPSQSEADMAFCNMLAFWTKKDETQMDRIFRFSGLMREKWDRVQNGTTYGAITIRKAISKCKDVYDVTRKEEEVVFNAITGEVDGKQYDLNDTGNAQRFVDRFGDVVRYNFDNNSFMVWTGTHWQMDIKKSVKGLAELVIDDMKKDAMREDDKELQKQKIKNAEYAFSSRGKENMLKESMHIGKMPCVNDDFDKAQMLFNTKSGVIDLTNGQVIPHRKEQMLSKISRIEMSENKPVLWLKFLDEIFAGDQEMIRFIQKSIGYSMSGSTKEQCMFICFGEGNNGKTVFLDVMSSLMGDYAVNAQVETVLSKGGGSGSSTTSDLARLKGARLVTTGEPNEGSRFNEGLVKQLTGGDRVTARFLYGREFEFNPEFKLWLATNYKPVIRGTDRGIWRRIRLIPFEVEVPKERRDKDLTAKLVKELPAILRWACEGCLIWQKEGLESPRKVEEATKEYKNEMDIINAFCEECCQTVIGFEEPVGQVYKEYDTWARTNNEFIMPLTRFGKEMSKRYDRTRKSTGIVYSNLRLTKHDTTYVFDKKKQ